ncbi:MAG TPA: YdcF family protein [Miltoncostaeaceae bacterium]|nr:YdcF family protein [Miltoncostaeaceae bacterium]
MAAAPARMSAGRVVAVLGFSARRAGALHPVCAARVRRAGELATADDVVLLSGWARNRGGRSEAELMRRAWRGAPSRILLDDGARHTAENAVNAAQIARELGASEVLVVTSRWHAPRAALFFRWYLRGSGVAVRIASARGPLAAGPVAREAAVWPLVPAQIARTPSRRKG